VTIDPRDGPLTTEPLSLTNQREVSLSTLDGREPYRLLEVQVRTDDSTYSVRGLLGELVEDSLLLDVSEAPNIVERTSYRFRFDQVVTLMMVVGCDPELGLIYLDGQRRWRRRPRGRSGGVQLVEEAIPPGEDLFLGSTTEEAWLCSASSYACNCPSFLGLELQDWRTGSAMGQAASNPVSGPLSPLRGDVLNEVARVYRLLDWERNPMDSCKHIHCARWMLGCPTVDPGDPPPNGNGSWEMDADDRDAEEFEPTLRPGTQLRVSSQAAQWQGLSALPVSVSAGDALSLTAYELKLYQSATGGLLLLPLEGVSTDPALAPIIDGGPAQLDRFGRLWPTEDRFQTEGRVGDVWVGKGLSSVAYPYQADGEPAPEPFITPAPYDAVAEP
jgi:hypothetical protein